MRKARRDLLVLCSILFLAASVSAEEIIIQGGRLRGTTRAQAVVKTKATTPATPPDTKIGIDTTFDLGADRLRLRAATKAALGLTDGQAITVDVGGGSNFIGNTITEDTVFRFDQVNLNAGKTRLANGLDASVTVGDFRFDAFGSDFLVNGVVGIYDPRAQPVKAVQTSSGVSLGTTGELALFPALVGGQTNPAISEAFNPSFKLDLEATAYGGYGARPTVAGSLTAGATTLPGKKALWDTGAPTSQIDRDLIGPGAGKLDLPIKNGRVIIPEVKFACGASTLTIRNLQATVQQRSNDVPLRIGTNVLDYFKMLVDMHDDPNTDGTDRFFGLQRRPVYQGNIHGGKVSDFGPGGSTINVQWTDASGALLLDANNMVKQETKIVPGGAGVYDKVEFTAPPDAVDFIQTVTTPAAAKSKLRVEAKRERAAGPSYAKEVGQDDDDIVAGWDLMNIWDKFAEYKGDPNFELTLPDLFVDSDGNGIFDANDYVLCAAVDLTEYLETVPSDYWNRDWINDEFYFMEGRAYHVGDNLELSGFRFVLAHPDYVAEHPDFMPWTIDLLAGEGEGIFVLDPDIDPQFLLEPPDGMVADVLAQHGILPEPSTGMFVVLTGIVILRRRR